MLLGPRFSGPTTMCHTCAARTPQATRARSSRAVFLSVKKKLSKSCVGKWKARRPSRLAAVMVMGHGGLRLWCGLGLALAAGALGRLGGGGVGGGGDGGGGDGGGAGGGGAGGGNGGGGEGMIVLIRCIVSVKKVAFFPSPGFSNFSSICRNFSSFSGKFKKKGCSFTNLIRGRSSA